jgi:hypothetical protein
MDKITGVLDALQNLFGKGFLLVGFLPITMLLTISWVLGCWLSPACRVLSAYLLRSDITQKLTVGAVSLLLLSLASFIFWLLNPWFRQALEGRIFPALLQDWLAQGHRAKLRKLQDEIQNLLTEVGLYHQASAVWPSELITASIGTGLQIADADLTRKYNSLKNKFKGLRPVPHTELDVFYRRLLTELATTSTTAVPPLGQIRDELRDQLLPAGNSGAERALYRKLTDRIFRYPAEEMSLGPTRLANVQEAQRDYIVANYGIDVSLFWSDLQKVAANDEKFSATLENAKLRLDFSVAMTAVSALFTTGWIIFQFAWGSDWRIYSAVTAMAGLAMLIFYRLVFISYTAFTDIVRTTVELFRFDLMKALHLELPPNDEAEQKAWLNLAQRLQINTRIPVPYHHA